MRTRQCEGLAWFLTLKFDSKPSDEIMIQAALDDRSTNMSVDQQGEEDTETKLAILCSIFTGSSQESLLDILIQADGNVERAMDLYPNSTRPRPHTDSPERPSKRLKSSSASPEKYSTPLTEVRLMSDVLKWTSSAETPQRVL